MEHLFFLGKLPPLEDQILARLRSIVHNKGVFVVLTGEPHRIHSWRTGGATAGALLHTQQRRTNDSLVLALFTHKMMLQLGRSDRC